MSIATAIERARDEISAAGAGGSGGGFRPGARERMRRPVASRAGIVHGVERSVPAAPAMRALYPDIMLAHHDETAAMTRDAILTAIASEHLGLETLEERRSSLDFKEQAVWTIKAALEAAYEAGRQSVSPQDFEL